MTSINNNNSLKFVSFPAFSSRECAISQDDQFVASSSIEQQPSLILVFSAKTAVCLRCIDAGDNVLPAAFLFIDERRLIAFNCDKKVVEFEFDDVVSPSSDCNAKKTELCSLAALPKFVVDCGRYSCLVATAASIGGEVSQIDFWNKKQKGGK